ncbi:MAG: hypothetical protein FWE74_01375 [Oscillospiraceae bacterium]|nr:hypothetical protein [Oscillospiraceae bacterium]
MSLFKKMKTKSGASQNDASLNGNNGSQSKWTCKNCNQMNPNNMIICKDCAKYK